MHDVRTRTVDFASGGSNPSLHAVGAWTLPHQRGHFGPVLAGASERTDAAMVHARMTYD